MEEDNSGYGQENNGTSPIPLNQGELDSGGSGGGSDDDSTDDSGGSDDSTDSGGDGTVETGSVQIAGKPNVSAGENTITVDATIENTYDLTDFEATVGMTVTSGTQTVASDDSNFQVGPNGTRDISYDISHNLDPGSSVTACVSVTSKSPVGGL